MAKPIIRKLQVFARQNRKELVLASFFSIALFASLYTKFEQHQVEDLARRLSEKEAALQALEVLVTQYPDSRDLLYQLSIKERELGNDKEASASMERARYLDPNNPILPTLEQLPHRP